MAGRRDDDKRGRPDRSGRPERGRSGGPDSGGRAGKGRTAGRPGVRGEDRRSEGRRGEGRGGDGRRDAAARGDRGPRPPIKGRRRTFDTDSAPNERERERLARSADEQEPGADRWVDEGPVRRAAGDAVRRGRSSGGRPGRDDKPDRNAPRRAQRAAKRIEGVLDIDRDRLAKTIGSARAARTIQRLGEATDAFGQDRFEDARRLLKPLAETAPDESTIRELYGLTLYRLGKWRLAAAELEEFVRRTGSTEQHPVLADCYRALRQHARVQDLWDELGAASPEAALIAEGRIVYAGSLADQGRLADAIKILEAGSLGSSGKLRYHHLRMRYVLADLYDRAGEQQAARRQFEAVAAADPDFFDVRDRLRQL